MHCSLVFLSSVLSEHLPSSPGRRSGRRATVDAAVLDQWNGGSAPIRRATPKVLSGGESAGSTSQACGRGRSALRGGSRPARTELPGQVTDQFAGLAARPVGGRRFAAC